MENIQDKYPKMAFLRDRSEKISNNTTDIYKYGSVYFGVDTFSQSEVLDIIQYIQEKGFNIISYKIRTRLLKSEIENLFLPNNSCNECGDFRWWMVQDTIELGPLMVLLIQDPKATVDMSCLKRINSHKGHGNPFNAEKNTIREKFSSINYSMNMVHIPDNTLDFIKDSTPFYDSDELIELINKFKTVKDLGVNFLEYHEIFDINSRQKSFIEKYNFFKSITILKFRIVKSIENKIACKDDILKYYNEKYTSNVYLNRKEIFSNYRDSLEEEMDILVQLKKNISSCLDIGFEETFNNTTIIKDILRLQLFSKLISKDKNIEFNQFDLEQLNYLDIYIPDIDKHIILTSLIQWNQNEY